MVRRPRALSPALVLVATGIVLAACAGGSVPRGGTSPDPAAPDLVGTSWTLVSYAGPDAAQAPAVAGPSMATLAFGADSTVSGSTGCNRFVGSYTQSGSALAITPGAMTEMACEGPVAEQETALLAALAQVAAGSEAGGRLVLHDAGGAVLLVYAPGLASVVGTSWRAAGVNNGRGGVETTAGTGAITAEFGADGVLRGSGGCNRYHAQYTLPGRDGITIGPVASTRMACAPDVMATEAAYFAALGEVATYQVEGDRLTLRDSAGATQVTYVQVG